MEIKIKPFSINKAFQGRRFMTKAYKEWREEMSWLLKKEKPVIADKYIINIEWWSPHANRADIDNPIKSCLDSLVENGIITDDRKIKELNIKKHKGDYKIKIDIKGK